MSGQDELLRSVVRELLAEALADRDQLAEITNDAELNAFVARLVDLFEQPEQREAVRAGRLRFRLATGAPRAARAANGSTALPAPPAGKADASPDLRVEAGALTERLVIAAAADGKTVVLGRRAVVTPLALDKARSLGVAVRREAV